MPIPADYVWATPFTSVYTYTAVSSTIVLGSYLLYDREIRERTNGADYESMLYATGIQWLPAMVAGINSCIHPGPNDHYSLLHDTF